MADNVNLLRQRASILVLVQPLHFETKVVIWCDNSKVNCDKSLVLTYLYRPRVPVSRKYATTHTQRYTLYVYKNSHAHQLLETLYNHNSIIKPSSLLTGRYPEVLKKRSTQIPNLLPCNWA